MADTNNHLIRVIDLKNNNAVTTLDIKGLQPPKLPEPPSSADEEAGRVIDVPRSIVKPEGGALRFAVKLTLPEGYKINAIAPMRYRVNAEGESGPVDRTAIGKSVKLDKPAAEFEFKVPLKSAPAKALAAEDALRVSLDYFYCQEGAEGLCKAGRATWNVPVKLAEDAGKDRVRLELKIE